jgi:hypothetical protein
MHRIASEKSAKAAGFFLWPLHQSTRTRKRLRKGVHAAFPHSRSSHAKNAARARESDVESNDKN